MTSLNVTIYRSIMMYPSDGFTVIAPYDVVPGSKFRALSNDGTIINEMLYPEDFDDVDDFAEYFIEETKKLVTSKIIDPIRTTFDGEFIKGNLRLSITDDTYKFFFEDVPILCINHNAELQIGDAESYVQEYQGKFILFNFGDVQSVVVFELCTL